MDDLDALLQHVMARPDDESPRELFADAAEGLDPDRATFIRLQLKQSRARRAQAETDPAWAYRTQILATEHARRWAEPVLPLVTGWSHLRGFVEVVRLDAARFLDVADELYARAPVLHLDLENVKPVAAELFASPHLRRIQSLDLMRHELGDEEAAVLAASPHLGDLEWLQLSLNEIGADGLEALAALQNLPRLGFLGFHTNAVDDPTPVHCDEWDATSEVGRRLQERYGHREWLDARPRRTWPPARDALHVVR